MKQTQKLQGGRSLLEDRLQLVRQSPDNPGCWHLLYQSVEAAPDGERASVLQTLRRLRPAQGRSALLAATFLDDFAGDEAELARAAAQQPRREARGGQRNDRRHESLVIDPDLVGSPCRRLIDHRNGEPGEEDKQQRKERQGREREAGDFHDRRADRVG